MLFFIATIWLISIVLILIFFKGATEKGNNMEIGVEFLGEEDK
ncbi:hypothetical protein [Clostridium gallinarum]|nr:hypothetical protein [Clostridium gallinarum]